VADIFVSYASSESELGFLDPPAADPAAPSAANP
jgi:hypothetical protein